MAHVFIPGWIEATLEATGPSGQQWLHKIGFRSPNASPDYSDCLTVAQTVATWWNSNYRNMVSSQVVGRRVVATAGDAMPSAQATVLLTLAGNRTGVQAPSEISAAMAFFTHLNGRRNHGGPRSWAPVTADLNGDHFNSAYMGAIVGVWQNLINAANTAGFPVVIASRTDSQLKTVAGVIAIDDIVDSERRRTINRGR